MLRLPSPAPLQPAKLVCKNLAKHGVGGTLGWEEIDSPFFAHYFTVKNVPNKFVDYFSQIIKVICTYRYS